MVAALGSHAERQDDSEVAEDSDAASMAPQSRNHATPPIRIIPVPRDEGQKRVDTLRAEIRSLGNVNLDSIEEELTLAARNDDLIKQVADLDAAGRQLRELIDRLNDASRIRFQETFLRVQEEFGGKNGMFRRLFGGGKAEVRLMPLIKEINGEKVETDEVDMLESGVEIIAKPPGKEPRSISQLSGGEKTLTAVSLLMAIFRSKPSCFCILDEVDAALDEGNVARFCNTIRQYTDFSRFIVITHNKRTMQSADRLYGVTMQERGVSKRVSVRFDQVKEDGSIIARPDAAQHDTAQHDTPQRHAPAATKTQSEDTASEAPAAQSGRRPSPARSRSPVVVAAPPEPAPIERPIDGRDQLPDELPEDEEPISKPSPSQRLRAAVEVAATEPPSALGAATTTVAAQPAAPANTSSPAHTPSPPDLASAQARPIVKPSQRLREALALVKSGSSAPDSATQSQ